MPLRTFFPLVLLLIVGSVASNVSAQSISECQALITALRVETQAVQMTGNNAAKDVAGLVSKLNESALKLDQAKFCDSVAKLNDFKARVQQLSGAGKISPENSDELSRDADAAIACVVNVAASTGVACAI
jgi:hypothetical protein